MAPKKKEVQKLSLGEFMQDSSYGGVSWADEVEDTYATGTQPLPASDRRGGGGGGSSFGGTDRYAGYARQERDDGPQQLPTKPPYTAHLGNLSYDATQEAVSDFFAGCEVTNVRIVEDREERRPKGFGYAEFATVEGLKKALELNGENFQSRVIRIRIADPPKDRGGMGGMGGGDSNRDLSDWSRKGPLPDLPGRSGGGNSSSGGMGMGSGERRGPREFSEARPPREGPVDDGKIRDFSNWERKGPLSPLAQPPAMERQVSRDGGRPRIADANRGESYRRASPAAWGEGRQDGSRPPRREFSDRPERPERAPTAAEQDNQWRSNMRPDAAPKAPSVASKSAAPSRSGSEAPSSPAPAAAVPAAPAAPVGRPKLNLQKRTNTDAPAIMSPSLTGASSKASPFGAARPIDTAAREKEIEEKHQQALKEKKEADEKAKEDRRLAKEAKDAATREAAAKAEEEALMKAIEDNKEVVKANGEVEEKPETAAAVEPTTDAGKEVPAETKEGSVENGATTEQKAVPIRPKEAPKALNTRVESGSWRTASGDRGPRNAPTGPRGGRGGGAPRGGGRSLDRREGSRRGGEPSTPTTPVPDEDGWTTVSAATKSRRTGRPIVS